MPDGDNGAGNIKVTVTVNANNAITEYNMAGAAQSNNTSAPTTFTAALANYPDLQVSGLALSPAAPVSGNNVTFNWNDINTGNGVTAGNWYDHVVIKNTSTGQTLADATLYYDASQLGNLAAFTGLKARSYSFRLPDGDPGVGNITAAVTVDSNDNMFEYGTSHAAAEANNTGSTSVMSTLAASS